MQITRNWQRRCQTGWAGKEENMECSRKLIYFNRYEDGCKAASEGYAGFFLKGRDCHVQIYYRGDLLEEGRVISPVYEFTDGSRIIGEEMRMSEGMAAASFESRTMNFLESGHGVNELECIYIEGAGGICGGRMDGRELKPEMLQKRPVETEEIVLWSEEAPSEAVTEKQEEPEVEQEKMLTLEECFCHFPELKLPFDGVRRSCCRLTLQEMRCLPAEWQRLKENNFLLHGFYEFHHLALVRLNCCGGERYALGVPGKLTGRDRYMAECFGFRDFAPLEPGKRYNGSFGYWYYYV